MVATEIATIKLKPGVDVKSEGKGKEIIDFVCDTIAAQEGCLSIAHGIPVEVPDTWELVIEWTDINDHKKFIASDVYPPFKAKVAGIAADEPGNIVINHTTFDPSISEVTSSPVVEMLLQYVPLDAGDNVVAAVENLIDVGRKAGAAVTSVAHGWVVEELEAPEKFEGKAKGYRVAIGWESIQKHMDYRETDAFKESIPPIRAAAKGMSVHHTAFTKHVKS